MKTYTCLSVKYADSKKEYLYLTDDPTIEKGDYVVVSDTVVRVVDVKSYSEKSMPIDLHKIKKIKCLYKKEGDIHFEHPIIADASLETDSPDGNRPDLFKMLDGVDYQQLDCLTEEEISSFEEKNQIELPLEYRRFLKEIGNGIRFAEPNPQFQYPNGQIRYREVFGIEIKKTHEHYKYVFPFRKEGYQGDDNPNYPECDYNMGEDLEDVCLACEHRYICPDGPEEFTEMAMHHGTMEITYAGCTYYYYLVLNGPHRGEVWISSEDRFIPFKKSFSEYLEWLLTSDHY